MTKSLIQTLIMRLILASLILLPVPFLGGCASASLDVTPLLANGQPDTNAAPGFRYYMPKVCLLVVELPPTLPTNLDSNSKSVLDSLSGSILVADTNNEAISADSAGSGGNGGSRGSLKNKPNTKNSGDYTNQISSSTATSPSPVSDVSFSAATPQYVAKLICLPDYQHPYAITVHPGIGFANFQPVLQDGWMLTSLNGQIDSKISDVITGALSSATTIASKAASNLFTYVPISNQTSGLPPDLSGYYTSDKCILRPGLYQFVETNDTYTLVLMTPFNGNMQATNSGKSDMMSQSGKSHLD